jgi:putative radical SAM enzyme (TIGR03279 family)
MADERVVSRRAKADRARVLAVAPASPADRAGVRVGDVLLAIDGVATLDIVDYRFQTAGESIVLEMSRGEEKLVLPVAKEYDQDIGIEFADDLFDRVHICKNKCVFCFLYQQPKGLRPSLYIKDDDYRLSFLHGNYLTLTNMGDDEFSRIVEQKLSPLFISVHATDPAVRGLMLGREPMPILPRLAMLAEAKIQVHAQVVLCPGYNDGDVLDRTVRDLSALHPATRGGFGGVLSVAIVPVGLTRFRDRLAALRTCSPEFNRDLVRAATRWRAGFKRALGANFVFLSDEIYLSAAVQVPGAGEYEGFAQIEDGVGLVRQFLDDHASVARRLPKSVDKPRRATMVTGELAAPIVTDFAATLSAIEGLEVNTAVVHNRFFEGNISVAGLLTGGDLARHLNAMDNALGDTVVIPSIMLRDPDRDIFLDDMPVSELAERIGRDVKVVDRTPTAAAKAILAPR